MIKHELVCYKCKLEIKTVKSFGKNICVACLNKRKTGRKGHSGMVYDKLALGNALLFNNQKINLIRVNKSNAYFTKTYIEHYPASKGIVGRQLNYIIYYGNIPCGIISATSPPLNYKKFNLYFDKQDTVPNSEFGKTFVNNSAFRIIKSPIRNFATQVLKVFKKRVLIDYEKQYGLVLKGMITFVEKPRTGSIYLADNWELIGETEGIEVRRTGSDWLTKTYTNTGNKKLIFGYKYPVHLNNASRTGAKTCFSLSTTSA